MPEDRTPRLISSTEPVEAVDPPHSHDHNHGHRHRSRIHADGVRRSAAFDGDAIAAVSEDVAAGREGRAGPMSRMV